MNHALKTEQICAGVREMIEKHAGSAFVGLIVQGSAVKGGFIEDCSDIDFILYADDSASRRRTD